MAGDHNAAANVSAQLPQIGKEAASKDYGIATLSLAPRITNACGGSLESRNQSIDRAGFEQRLISHKEHGAGAVGRDRRQAGNNRLALAVLVPLVYRKRQTSIAIEIRQRVANAAMLMAEDHVHGGQTRPQCRFDHPTQQRFTAKRLQQFVSIKAARRTCRHDHADDSREQRGTPGADGKVGIVRCYARVALPCYDDENPLLVYGRPLASRASLRVAFRIFSGVNGVDVSRAPVAS